MKPEGRLNQLVANLREPLKDAYAASLFSKTAETYGMAKIMSIIITQDQSKVTDLKHGETAHPLVHLEGQGSQGKSLPYIIPQNPGWDLICLYYRWPTRKKT